MPGIKQLSKSIGAVKTSKAINWFPGHMHSGMQAMMGKLNTVDCIVEVHDARIPFIGRNRELKQQLGTIKPRLLVLNKTDLADLTNWDRVKEKLRRQGDENVFLTDMSGTQFGFQNRGYTNLLNAVMQSINRSDRFNRQESEGFKIMIVGIPNVGKSTLINRLRQLHLGKKGEPAKTNAQAGYTKHVENKIKICSRPPIYSLDTPGILEPSATKNRSQAMTLALCSTIKDQVVDPEEMAAYLLEYLNEAENYSYMQHFNLSKPASCLLDLVNAQYTNPDYLHTIKSAETNLLQHKPDYQKICWHFIKKFRNGVYGKVMFD